MSLDSLLTLGYDYAFAVVGDLSDRTSTYVGMHKLRGRVHESHVEMAGRIRELGLGRALLGNFIQRLPKRALLTVALWEIDYALGIDDNVINFHHAFCYGAGSLSYLTAIHNVFLAYGLNTLADIAGYIPEKIGVYANTLSERHTGRTIFRP